MCDEKGKIINGDQIMQCLPEDGNQKILKGGVVGTHMSNYGLERFLIRKN